ncbi:hypothetical protein Tco_1448395 [Tanacetum coccineum]
MEVVSSPMVAAAKLPVLNPGEFELWKIRIEQYFLMTDYAFWEVIVNGDSPPPKRIVDGVEQTYPLITAEEKLARKNKLKVRGTLLMTLPNEHQLKFNTYKCAKTLMEAIEKSSNQAYGSNSANTDKKMDLKWQMVMLTMRARRFLNKTGRKISFTGSDTIRFNKSKVEYYNCHKMDHFAKECRAPRENRNREPAEEGPINFALMAYTSSGSSSSSSSDFEVSTCSKACLKSYETLKEHYDNLTKDFNKSQLNVGAYKAGLESVEARLDVYKKNEVVFKEDIKILKLDIMLRDNALTELRKKFEKAKKERDDLKLTLEKFENSSKNLSKLLEIQVSDKFKTSVGYDSQVVDSQVFDSQVNDKYKTGEGYHAVPPPYTGNFMPPKPNLVLADEEEYVFSESITSVHAVETSKDENENGNEFKSKQRKPSFAKVEFVKSNEHVKIPRKSVDKGESPNSQGLTHPHPKGNFIPKAVLMKSGHKTLNTARQNSSKAAVSVNTARPINTAYLRPTVNINTVRRNVTTIGSKAVVSDNKGNKANAVKASACWIYVCNGLGPHESLILLLFVQGNPQLELQEKEVIDSGCSRHITGNKSYLSDYEEIDGGFVAFEGDPKGGKITGKVSRFLLKEDWDMAEQGGLKCVMGRAWGERGVGWKGGWEEGGQRRVEERKRSGRDVLGVRGGIRATDCFDEVSVVIPPGRMYW